MNNLLGFLFPAFSITSVTAPKKISVAYEYYLDISNMPITKIHILNTFFFKIVLFKNNICFQKSKKITPHPKSCTIFGIQDFIESHFNFEITVIHVLNHNQRVHLEMFY